MHVHVDRRFGDALSNLVHFKLIAVDTGGVVMCPSAFIPIQL